MPKRRGGGVTLRSCFLKLVQVGLGKEGVGVGVEGHQVAHVGLVGAEHPVVQRDEVVVVLVVDDVVDKAVIDRDVAVDDTAPARLAEIDLEP